MFKIKLEKKYGGEDHPDLKAEHPRVGNWSETQMWDHQVKEPIKSSSLGNYLYVMECKIGSETDGHQLNNCVFDASTSISTAWYYNWHLYTHDPWRTYWSNTYKNLTTVLDYESLGLNFQGWSSKDSWCLGNEDVHTTVCMDDQLFSVAYAQKNGNDAMWAPPFKAYDRVNAIVGLANSHPKNDPDGSYSFVKRAYD